MKDMYDDIDIVEQDPVPLSQTFAVGGKVTGLRHPIIDRVGDRFNVNIGISRHDDKVIADGRDRFQFENLDVETFFGQGQPAGQPRERKRGRFLQDSEFLLLRFSTGKPDLIVIFAQDECDAD